MVIFLGSILNRVDLYTDFQAISIMMKYAEDSLWKTGLSFIILPLAVECFFIIWLACENKDFGLGYSASWYL